MMACRTAGRLGAGGGPGRRAVIFSPLRPMVLGQAQVLQVGVGEARHQRVPVQPRRSVPAGAAGRRRPRARLDRANQRASRRARRQVGQVVLALARRAPLAHQPVLCPLQVPVVAPDRAVADPHAGGGEAGRQRALRAQTAPAAAPLAAGSCAHSARGDRVGRAGLSAGASCAPSRPETVPAMRRDPERKKHEPSLLPAAVRDSRQTHRPQLKCPGSARGSHGLLVGPVHGG